MAARNGGSTTRQEHADEASLVDRAKTFAERVQGWKAVRVFTHYGAKRGAILAAGMAFQSIFAVFAAIWVGFSIAGLVLANNVGLRTSLVELLADAVPGLIDAGDGEGAIDADALLSSSVVFSLGAIIALAGLLWKALSWFETARDAVRSVFGQPKLQAGFVLVKLKDLGFAGAFGLAFLVSAALSVAGTAATGLALDLIGIGADSTAGGILGRVVTLGVMFLLDAALLGVLFRILSGLRIPWGRLRTGILIGAAGLGVLKVLGSSLLGGATSNPLFASFAVIIGLLIFFNFVCQVMLVSASWIAVDLDDHGIVVDEDVEAQRLQDARELLAAHGEYSPPKDRGFFGRLFRR